jgi:hypothetical protein
MGLQGHGECSESGGVLLDPGCNGPSGLPEATALVRGVRDTLTYYFFHFELHYRAYESLQVFFFGPGFLPLGGIRSFSFNDWITAGGKNHTRRPLRMKGIVCFLVCSRSHLKEGRLPSSHKSCSSRSALTIRSNCGDWEFFSSDELWAVSISPSIGTDKIPILKTNPNRRIDSLATFQQVKSPRVCPSLVVENWLLKCWSDVDPWRNHACNRQIDYIVGPEFGDY